MKQPLLALTLAALLPAGCASYSPGVEYPGAPSPPHQPAERKEYPGVVESVREVEMPAASTGIGSIAGAVIGSTIGGSVGRGRGAAAGEAVGVVVGGIMGQAAELAASQPGLEIAVKLDEGRNMAVTQPVTAETFRPGDRVRVISDGLKARVTRIPPEGGQEMKEPGGEGK